jgi:glucosamine--fructose-6-phosphate aminotransferase (isomerizing)
MDGETVKRSLSGYLAELSGVPQALERVCRFAEADGKTLLVQLSDRVRNSSNVYFFGMASSLWASLPIVWGLKRLGISAHSISAYDGLRFPVSRIPRRSIVVFISQSGETIEIKRLVEQIKASSYRPLMIGVTNAPDSFLALQADITLDVLAGSEYHAPSKSFTNTLAVLLILYALVARRSSRDSETLVPVLAEIASRMSGRQAAWQRWGARAADLWSEAQGPVQFLACGPQMASAWQSSMLCAETARSFSAAGEWATFRHGFEPQINKSYTVIGFRPAKRKEDVWQTTSRSIADRGGRVLIVPNSFLNICAETRLDADMIAPIWETLPIHWLCISMAKSKGLDASQIERKITLEL